MLRFILIFACFAVVSVYNYRLGYKRGLKDANKVDKVMPLTKPTSCRYASGGASCSWHCGNSECMK